MSGKVFSNEKWEKVCSSNKELLRDFLLELRSNKYSAGTISQYRCDLRMLFCYMLDNMDNKNILDLSRKDFRNIKMWYINERKVSPARCNRVMSSIHSMLDYAEEDDDYNYDFNVSKKIKGLTKEGVREIIFLEDPQVERLRNFLLDQENYKLAALLDLLYDSGARRNEIWQVTKHDLLDRNYTNIVVGKGGKKFPLVYFSRFKESLKLYLDQRGEDDIDALWIIGEGENKRTGSISVIYSWIMEMREILFHLEQKPILITPHSFRHSALENMKNGTHYICRELDRMEGFSLQELKVYAHHEATSTTESYLKKNDNNVLASMFNINIA